MILSCLFPPQCIWALRFYLFPPPGDFPSAPSPVLSLFTKGFDPICTHMTISTHARVSISSKRVMSTFCGLPSLCGWELIAQPAPYGWLSMDSFCVFSSTNQVLKGRFVFIGVSIARQTLSALHTLSFPYHAAEPPNRCTG